MELKNKIELENTKAKLARLEARYAKRLPEGNGDDEIHRLSMQSLKRMMNQFKEEIVRYEAHQLTGRS